MKFILPCIEYEQKAIEFIKEFYDYDSQINGTGGLDRFLKESTYSDWLVKVIKDLNIANIPEGRVPAYTYFYVREEDDKIVGMINIRLALNDFLRKEGGHIGYCIRPTERRKGYGTQMLHETLAFCRTIGLLDVMISCDKTNLASAGVIKTCGGILEREFFSETYNEILQMYKIINNS
ncbi:MAG: GNAT family N-acetyltransferase [Oscillospiraceae bacterium]|nr:GNAT family N-acetyltransferase [Oscillospiraceae bacterium]